MDIPLRLLNEAVERMRQHRGNEALDLLRNYEIGTFGQLEAACHRAGVESWKPKEADLHKNAPDYWEA